MLLFMWLFGRSMKIEPVEAIAWSQNGARLGLVFGLVFSLIFKLVLGFVFKALNQFTFFLTTPAFVLFGIYPGASLGNNSPRGTILFRTKVFGAPQKTGY